MADLIFDRTQADVDEVTRLTEGMKNRTLTEAERKQYFSEMKGRYSYTDLNRVEAKAAEVASLLTASGYPTSISVKTNWRASDKLRRADIVRYLDNIATIRRILPEVMAPPAVPISRWLDYAAANDIERTLWAVESALDGITQYLRRCGTFAAGGSYAAQIIRRA
jgi:hypothetical protein